MTGTPNEKQHPIESDEQLVRALADDDATPEIRQLRSELESLGSEVRESDALLPYENEAACREAGRRVREARLESATESEQAVNPTGESDTELGSLGHYKLLSLLGQGGMGSVYRALHTNLNRHVAVKVLPADRLQDDEFVHRFRREMQAVGQLDHPNIVRAMDAGEVDGKHYLAMELLEGIDLSSLVKQAGPMKTADACELIRQAACALQEAHRHGMVHRDVKPSNLMLVRVRRGEAPPQVKLLDLGLASLGGGVPDGREITSTGQVMGTFDYMAPEQGVDSRQVDVRADIYGLGATLYRLLTGDVPFPNSRYGTLMAKMTAIANEAPTPIGELRRDVPQSLAKLVAGMLAKQPDERPATPDKLAEALCPHCAGSSLARLLDVHAPQDATTSAGNRAGELTETQTASSADESAETKPLPPSDTSMAWSARERSSLSARRLTIGFTLVALAVAATLGSWAAGWLSSDTETTGSHPNSQSSIVNRSSPELPDASSGSAPEGSERESDATGSGLSPTEILTSDRFEWSTPVRLGPAINTDVEEAGPTVTADGLVLIFWRQGKASKDLWISRRESTNQPFGEPVPLNEQISTPFDELEPSVTGDGLVLVFRRTERSGRRINADIWMASRSSTDDPFDPPERLGPEINTGVRECNPSISSDGLTMVVSCDGASSIGGTDHWIFRRDSRDAPFGDKSNPGPTVNTPEWDESAAIAPDGLSLVITRWQGEPNRSSHDLWICTRANRDSEFGEAVSLGSAVNSDADEMRPFISADGRHLYFDSDRGSESRDLWVIERTRKDKSRAPQVSAAALPVNITPERLPARPTATRRSSGRFHDSGQRLGNSRSAGVALGDLDGDGDLDAFIVNRNPPHRVWINDGKGHFQDSGESLGDIPGISCRLGDVDGDGDLDAVVCGYKAAENRIWLNSGDGRFVEGNQRIGSASNMAFGDLDGDGDLDLCGLGPQFWQNTGDGRFVAFEPGAPAPTDGINQQVAFADLDRDGDLDLFLSMYGARDGSRIWSNDGGERFQDVGRNVGGGARFTDVELGDLDGDGDVDAYLATYKHRTNDVHIWLNDGTGVFLNSGQLIGVPDSRVHTATLGDIDGDGDLDIVVDNVEAASDIYVNNGQGEFAQSEYTLGDGAGQFTALGDLDADGDLDAFLANDEGDSVSNQVWLNDNDGEQRVTASR